MTPEKYEAMVSRLEEAARRDPAKYRLRVGLLAAAGYGYILLIVGLLVAMAAAIVYVSWRAGRVHGLTLKFGWIVLALAWFVLEAVWVRMPPPEGIELRREDAPELFALVGEITAALGAPRIDHILVDAEYNASVAQVPRLGPLGWFRNYLTLGLPLMQALSPEHFRAVLGHELGHLSGNHGRFTGWIYRVRESWVMLLERFQLHERWGAFLFNWFFNWYAPYFYAYSFVLARTHEYEADAAAARLAGPGVMADALIAFRTMGAHLHEGYWPEVFKRADTEPGPARGSFARLSEVLREPLPAESAAGYLRGVLSEETAHDDTHPALAARLAALGHPAGAKESAAEWAESFTLAPLAETAAARYLGGREKELAEQLDEVWQRSVADDWRERHRYVAESLAKLKKLEEKASAGPLTPDQSFELGKLTAEFKEDADAVPLLSAVPRQHPRYAEAQLLAGHVLLGRGEEEAGFRHYEEAIARDANLTFVCAQSAFFYLAERGRADEAERWRARAEKFLDSLQTEAQ